MGHWRCDISLHSRTGDGSLVAIKGTVTAPRPSTRTTSASLRTTLVLGRNWTWTGTLTPGMSVPASLLPLPQDTVTHGFSGATSFTRRVMTSSFFNHNFSYIDPLLMHTAQFRVSLYGTTYQMKLSYPAVKEESSRGCDLNAFSLTWTKGPLQVLVNLVASSSPHVWNPRVCVMRIP